MDSRIDLEFGDGYRLVGRGCFYIEGGRLMGEPGGGTVEVGEVLRLEITEPRLLDEFGGKFQDLDDGEYLVTKHGLYQRVHP